MNLENLFIKQISVGPMMNFAYLVGDKSTKDAVIIDPGWEGARLIEEAKKEGFKISNILATHTHFDHINEVHYLVNALDVPTYVHKDEVDGLQNLANVKRFGNDGHIKIGDLDFQALHTPGHTKGSVSFLIDSALFTGDTLFIDNIGRTDLEGGDVEEMFNSMVKLRELPENVIVYPGHHYGPAPTATIGYSEKI